METEETENDSMEIEKNSSLNSTTDGNATNSTESTAIMERPDEISSDQAAISDKTDERIGDDEQSTEKMVDGDGKNLNEENESGGEGINVNETFNDGVELELTAKIAGDDESTKNITGEDKLTVEIASADESAKNIADADQSPEKITNNDELAEKMTGDDESTVKIADGGELTEKDAGGDESIENIGEGEKSETEINNGEIATVGESDQVESDQIENGKNQEPDVGTGNSNEAAAFADQPIDHGNLFENLSLMIDEGPASPEAPDSSVADSQLEKEIEKDDYQNQPAEISGASNSDDIAVVEGPPETQNQPVVEVSSNHDDDDIIVVASNIKSVAPVTSTSENAEPSLPQLTKSGSIDSNEAASSSVGSDQPIAALIDGNLAATAIITTTTTSVADVLKALAMSQAAASNNNSIPTSTLKLSLPRLGIVTTKSPNISAPLKTAGHSSQLPLPTAVGQLQQTNGRQLLPKPTGIANASGPSQGTAQRPTILQQKPQGNQDAVLTNGTASKTTQPGQNYVIPSYLKTVLQPASVLPYRSEMPAKEWGFLTPDGGYPCEECGDSFALKSCLEFHLQRRSMVIESNCLVCRQPLVFFNKCVYYAHIRSHSGAQRQVGKYIMRNVNVKPISWSLMELAFEDTAFRRMSNLNEFFKYETGRPIASIVNGDDDVAGANNSTQIGGDKAAAATNSLAVKLFNAANGNVTIEQQSLPPPPTKMRCSECHQEFGSAAALRQHFMYNLPPSQKQLICTSCQAVYFSECSFKAHTRTHTTTAPFVCPECGSVEKSFPSLNSHVMGHQKNPTVMDAWRCQKCLTFYSSWDALIVHMAASHCDGYFRCQHCPMAFQSEPAFKQHLQQQHDNIPHARSTDTQLLTKCCQCDVVYMSREPLLEHLRTHYQKLLPFIVYRCALCGRLMENKSGLMGHFRNVHRLNVTSSEVIPVKIQVQGTSPTKRPAPQDYEKQGASSNPAVITCSICPNNLVFENMVSLKLHMKRRHADQLEVDTSVKRPRTGSGPGLIRKEGLRTSTDIPSAVTSTSEFKCGYCSKVFSTSNGLMDDGRRHLRESVYVCILCQNANCGGAQTLSKHLERHVVEFNILGKGLGRHNYECEGHCNRSFISTADAVSHLREIHLLPQLQCFPCNLPFSTDESLRQHLMEHNDAHKGPTSKQRFQPSDIAAKPRQYGSTADAEGQSARQRPSIDISDSSIPSRIRCNKCGVWLHDLDTMHAHALLHKEPKYYLCLECGLSFAATSSLGRHLIVAHKIGNVDKYLQDHADANPDKPSELECSVCHMEFPSKPLLDSHVRTHGLLFLKTKARPSAQD